MNNGPGEWVVAYHGVRCANNPSYDDKNKKVLNSIMDGRIKCEMLKSIPGGA